MFFSTSRRPKWVRPVALFSALCFGWSFVLATPVQALAQSIAHPKPREGVRTLSAAEMQQMFGSQKPGGSPHATAYSEAAGSTYPWEESVHATNTGNGNKTTSIPIVGWTARGGMPVAFTIMHNSQSAHNSELGYKWTHSFDIFLVDSSGNMTVHWGDDLAYTFTLNVDGSYSAPTGIHDTLVKNVDNTYTLTRPSQIQYHFKTNLYCDTISDENSNVITISYNTGNYVTSISDPTSRSISLSYDTSNRISTVTDPLSRVWTMHYTSGDLTSVDEPTINSTVYSTTIAYNSAHDITTLTSPGGRLQTFTYNSVDDSLATETDGCSNTTSWTYTSSATTITDANSHSTVINYSSGRVSSIVDAASQTEYYYYDTNNNRLTTTDKRGYDWVKTFDSAGNVLTSKDPYNNTTTMTYNSHNKVLTVTDPMSHQVVNTYDSYDNLTEIKEKDSGGTVISDTVLAYDSNGLLTSKTDTNSHITAYGHNTNGELTSVTTPLGNETDWTVDGLGNRTSRTDALSRTTSYTLDAWKRVSTITYPDTSTKTFTRDADNLLTQFVDSTGTTSRTYDNDGRITAETKGSASVSYSYDATGKKGLLSTLTDQNSRVLTYSYTARNQLYTVAETAGTTSYSYDENGNETGISNPNSTTVTKTYDHAGHLTSVVNANSSSTTLSSFSYVYNNDGLRTSVTEADSSVVSYGYDGAHRLTSETRTGTGAYSVSYSLDGEGNRTSQTAGTATTSFTLDNDDELTATSSSTGGFVNSYSYNLNGEQTGRTLSGTSYTLAYDYDGQLTSITQGTNVTSFAYDAEGRRTSRTAGGTTTNFLYAGSQILLEKQGSTTTATYTYGNNLIRKDSEVPLFDGLGTERTVTNGSQTVTGTLITSAFGVTVATTGSSSNSYMFAATSGYRNDGDAGLMHVGARYYDAQVGRFITRDTELDQAAYLYCEHDPVNELDSSGHSASGHGNPNYDPSKVIDILDYIPRPIQKMIVITAIGVGLALIFPAAAVTVLGGALIWGFAAVVTCWIFGESDQETFNEGLGGFIGGGITGGAPLPWVQDGLNGIRQFFTP